MGLKEVCLYLGFRMWHLSISHFSVGPQTGTPSTLRGKTPPTRCWFSGHQASNSKSSSAENWALAQHHEARCAFQTTSSFFPFVFPFSVFNRMMSIKALSSRNSPERGTCNDSTTKAPEESDC